MKIFDLLIEELLMWFEGLFIKNTPGRIGVKLRNLYWSMRLKKSSSFNLSLGCVVMKPQNISIGKKANIMHNCCLYAHNNGLISIGDRVSINSNVQLGAADNGEIHIGNDVNIGPNVVIRASNHAYNQKNTPINQQGHSGGKIVIEDDVWIAANVVVLPNVKISRGAVVAAGAVVKDDVPEYALVAGVPAKILKENCRS